MSAVVYDTLILSDVHLGAEVSRARAATRMLQENSFRRLILLGDIFADLNFGRLKKEHWKFLGAIRKLSNPKRKVEVVWVEGNHDLGLTNVMSHLVGVRVFQEYSWRYAGLTSPRNSRAPVRWLRSEQRAAQQPGHATLSATAEARSERQSDRAAHRPLEHALAAHVGQGGGGRHRARA